ARFIGRTAGPQHLYWPVPEPLYQGLLRWSQCWHLDEDWCRERAGATLKHWYHQETLVGPEFALRWALVTEFQQIPFRADDLRIEFTHAGWHPLSPPSRGAAKAEIMAAFEEHLERRLDQAEALARAA